MGLLLRTEDLAGFLLTVSPIALSISHSPEPWVVLHVLNRAGSGLFDGFVLLNLVGIRLGCLQLKNS